MSFVSTLARHGALKCSKGIRSISLFERNIFPRENTIFISLENDYKNHQKCNITITPSPSSSRQKALDLERSNGGERAESKCRKDKGHDLWYGTGSPAEFRRVPMRCLSHWRGQQQHLLQRL